MDLSLFFDVEDCITPVSDDIAKDLAEIVSAHGLVGNFMVVGEKARVLESRGRHDVIEALRRHEIGLHSDRHSRHPTVAEYLEDKSWDDGIEEAIRREGPGVETIRCLFGKAPTCWGVPGGSWGPQIHPALKRLGVPIIVYPETYTPSSDVHWYAGALTFGYRRFFEGFDFIYSDSEQFQRHFHAFQATVDVYLKAGYAWMGLFCAHPITVRAYEFGDVLNFGRGKETPPELWEQPPLKSTAEYRTALQNFAVLVDYIAAHPRLHVAPVGVLQEKYGQVIDSISLEDLLGYATVAARTDDISTDDDRLSPAEAVDVMVRAILALANRARPVDLACRHVDGPLTMPPEGNAARSVDWDEFRLACEYVQASIERTGQLPASVAVAGASVGVGSFYHAACRALVACAGQQRPHRVTLRPGPQLPTIAGPIAQRTADGYRGWVIHKPDLNMTNLLELTRLQTWTLKRARDREAPGERRQ